MPERRPLPVYPPRRPGDGGLAGRGASANPRNRFERLSFAWESEQTGEAGPAPTTSFFRDSSRSILSWNDSPDVGFDVAVNPYRGCEHGCIYCYARPFHEYLGWSAGLDFESKILVKEDAPELLRQALMTPRWQPRVVALSGVTDPYQPVEARLGITRRCLEILAEFRNPVSIVTKSHLVTRDADILAQMAGYDAAVVSVSITTLDRTLQRVMEPRAATPERRLDAIGELTAAGVPVRVLAAPVIPGLTDHELPAIIAAAADAGAVDAGFIVLRLPHGLRDLFTNWLEERFPQRKEKVLSRIRAMRGGALYDSSFDTRGRGEGPFAAQIRDLFHAVMRKAGLPTRTLETSIASFRRPTPPGGQLGLFGEPGG
ncbi:MAG: PA0069 family radical SAM protein [Gemmatimonadota bacterium]